jgi:hypothetical protein
MLASFVLEQFGRHRDENFDDPDEPAICERFLLEMGRIH